MPLCPHSSQRRVYRQSQSRATRSISRRSTIYYYYFTKEHFSSVHEPQAASVLWRLERDGEQDERWGEDNKTRAMVGEEGGRKRLVREKKVE